MPTVGAPGPSNAVAQANLANLSDPGFKGDLPGLQRRMERSLGISFSSVRIVGGEAGEAGLSAGAIATTRGDSI